MGKEFIRIGGARQHNLKNVSLSIPRNKLVVCTGVSGSGKSSLAFDTIYAEGQRKYVESISSYARQFLDQMQKPDVDFIDGLSPAIAIEQRGSSANPRSIIATTTEIFDYLRLLYATVGQPHCPISGEPLVQRTTSDIVDELLTMPARTRVMLLAPVISGEKGEFRDVLERLAREGFVRGRVDGEMVELAPNNRLRLDAKAEHHIEVVVDRLVVDDKVRIRLSDSVETALKWGQGRLLAVYQHPQTDGAPPPWLERMFSNRMHSSATGESYERPEPKHFSFNSPFGACPVCHGLGQELEFDEELVAPDQAKSLEQGAVEPWHAAPKRLLGHYHSLLQGLARHFDQSMEAPFHSLSEAFRRALFWGTGDQEIEVSVWKKGAAVASRRRFEGVIPYLQQLYAESESDQTRQKLKAWMSPRTCGACLGKRLRPEILAVTLESDAGAGGPARGNPVPGVSIMDFCAMSIQAAHDFLETIELSEFQQRIAAELIREARARLSFLQAVGLAYLTLDRESGGLSGGEAQRIRLATQIGAGLVGVLYVLDEPSVGLHQRDNERLLQTLESLRDLGNSVIVVEHDEDTIRRADFVVDLGPGAGVQGGEVVAAGTPAEIIANPKSLTGRYLRGDLVIAPPATRTKPSRERGWIEVLGATENNLKNIDFRVPLGLMTCVTGVSGSGKSTLVDDVLRRALFRSWYGSKDRPGRYREIKGLERIDKVIVIDQAPIGRTPRSNPATYTGMFNHIRDLFARLPAAKIRGYGAGRFSFNVKGGRCEKCQGDGVIKIEMHFLPPVFVTCEGCDGQRYNRETLEMTYKGLNIANVLDLTVDEGVTFFRAIPQIHDALVTLAEVGLGYIRIGQAATTLSGGEAQRVKLASELSRKATGKTLYILDEPTSGLHFHDVQKLLEALFKLKAAGNTLLIIEHNLDVIKTADWVVDLGPEGGEGGGRIVAEGSPEQIAECEGSHTGKYLLPVLQAAKVNR